MDQRRCETVMIVNDDRSFIDIVGDTLRAEGLAVLLVPGVRQAIQAIQTGFRADAILLDLVEQEPIRDLLDTLRADRELCTVPVIARSRRSERLLQIAPGYDVHRLDVPSDPEALVALIERASARHSSDDEERHAAT
jgi:DNA-binding NtrC family response regulator